MRTALSSLAMTLVLLISSADAAEEFDLKNAFWHVRLEELFKPEKKKPKKEDTKKKKKKKKPAKGADIDAYLVGADGKLDRGVATARRFNRSVHQVTEGDLVLDGDQLKGKLTLRMTPDAWIPYDGKPRLAWVTIEGKFKPKPGDTKKPYTFEGRYTARYQNHRSSDAEEIKSEGKCSGAAERADETYDTGFWRCSMYPVRRADLEMDPQLQLRFGIHEKKVLWAEVGRLYTGQVGAPPHGYLFETTGFTCDGKKVLGKTTLPARALDPAIDPKATAELEADYVRVQGLLVGHTKVTYRLDGKVMTGPFGPFETYGRGEVARGDTKADPRKSAKPWYFRLDKDPWHLPVQGFVPPKPGEHPRLLFRKSDLPALRKKAKTPDGQAILKRLRVLLNGSDGEGMPIKMRASDIPYGDQSTPMGMPVGALSMSHIAGYGLLYQITGDKKYADLGRKCAELALEGYRDRDGKARYSCFRKPTGPLRAGPSLGWFAVGYDLCYDGWDEDFRKKIALEIQNYNEGSKMSLEHLVRGCTIPGSNHYGMQVGGGALAILAIMGDPGVDMKIIGPMLKLSEKACINLMNHGFGDHGFFAEGDGTGSMASHIAFLPALQAYKNAMGMDWGIARPHPQWMVLKWIHQTVVVADQLRFPTVGGYGHNVWARSGLSGAGYFVEGFGVLPEKIQPALLWYYNQFLKEKDAAKNAPFDTVSPYPHFAIMSFVNWPVDMKPVNPAELIPNAWVDTVFEWYACRNRWQDEEDIRINIGRASGPCGYILIQGGSGIYIAGLGGTGQWQPDIRYRRATSFRTAENGSAILDLQGAALAVDFSEASGAPCLLVTAGLPAVKRKKPDDKGYGFRNGNARLVGTELEAGGHRFEILTLQKGKAPKPEVKGNAVVIGKQKISYDGKALTLAVF